MSNVSRWRRYLRLARPNVAADVDDELQFHIQMRVERNIAMGMSPDDARRDAMLRFGDVDIVRDSLIAHDKRQLQAEGRRELVSDFIQDVCFGLRSLRRAPGFAIAATLTLALGIGANAAIFSVVDAILLRPLPYARPHELVSIGQGSAGEYAALQDRLRSFASLAGWAPRELTVDDGETAVRLEGAGVTTNLLPTLGVSPILGRGFEDVEGKPGAEPVAIISFGFWQRQFNGARDAIGKRLLMDGVSHTIIGVMPPGFHFPDKDTQYWLPLAFNPANVAATWAVGGGRFVGRVKSDVTLARAAREVHDVWPTLRTLNPIWDPGPMYRVDATATPLQDAVVGSASRVLWLLFGSVIVVLLVGCVNVANLLLARAASRERELSVRAALGGGRGRLIRQLVTESLLLSTIGTLLGVGLAYAAVHWLVSVMPAGVPRAHEISMNGGVLAFTAAIGVATGILFGIIPAMRATNFETAERSGGGAGFGFGRRTTHGTSHQRVSGLLVAAEVALAVLLVIGSSLLVRSFSALRRVEPGFNTTHVIAARLSPPTLKYEAPGSTTSLYESVMQRIAALPGVQNVAMVDKLPIAQPIWGIAARIEGQFEDAAHSLPEIGHYQEVSPTYFATLGIPVLRGRAFTEADRANQPPVTIVSESVARHFWPREDAIGKRVGYPWESPWLTIVGVVPDTKQDSLRDTLRTSMYVPWQQRTRMSGMEMWILVRGSGDPATIATATRAIVRETDRAVPVSDLRTMDAVLSDSVQKARFTMLLVLGFAIAALLLGAIGIYGVMSYIVGQRTQEMGIRLALGAPLARVVALVVGRATKFAVAGALVGVLIALLATRSLGALLYGISARDPVTFVGVPLLFLVVAVVASYAPARRATRVNPVAALRSD